METATRQRQHLSLNVLPDGKTYEDRYGGYLEVFRFLTTVPGDIEVQVDGAPMSWLPLLMHLNCSIMSKRKVFQHCPIVDAALSPWTSLDRTMLEVLSGFRPETTDALWKIDMQWPCQPGRVRQYRDAGEFIVTTNGAFYRPEVLRYFDQLDTFAPDHRKVVLVPCAADKPYPSPLHRAVLDILPPDYYLAVVTGTCGLVPQPLWPVMPDYDAGLPNEWRVVQTVSDYFDRIPHQRIVVYSDFNGPAIQTALILCGQLDRARFVIAPRTDPEYLDLLDTERLRALKSALEDDNQP